MFKRKSRSIIAFYLLLIIALSGEFNIAHAEDDITSDEIKTTADGVKYLIHPDKIVSGGPPMDGIPAIDRPRFVSVKEADKWIKDNELALAITHKGVEKVYPLQIMVWHEIVNDFIAGDPILITYCPLCFSGIAYVRELNGKAVEFGTSGKLYNSNMVMYDRETESYWSQIYGRAMLGDLTGMRLKPISIDTVVWRDYKKAHPDAKILSKETGFKRQYGRDPYGSYYEDSVLYFNVENKDDRVHPKTFIYGVEIKGVFKAYREDDLKKLKKIEDTVAGVKIRLTRADDGVVKVINIATGVEIVKESGFWFSWYAFHPDTLLYKE